VKIVGWNCCSGFHRKWSSLVAMAPDVAIISECADLDTLRAKAPGFQPSDAFWVGHNRNKGLGVFAFGEFRLHRHGGGDPALTYAIPVRVRGPATFNVLSVWAHHGKNFYASAMQGPAQLAVHRYRRFLSEGPSVVIGDLNNHVRWNRPRKLNNHANLVSQLETLGLVSAYHHFHAVPQGGELHPTLYWRDRTRDGPTYHIDYGFVPRTSSHLLRSVTVGTFDEWIATGLSDHVPLVIDLDPSFSISASAPPGGAARFRHAGGDR
jgi:exodeoxyribonuclease-3